MKRTIIIGGNFRGGTTATTRVFQTVGVYMGPPARMGFNQEDIAFQRVFHQRRTINKAALQALIKRRNKERGIWGFKYPGIYNYLTDTVELFRAPHVVLVLRDPVAVARSEYKRTGARFPSVLNEVPRVNAKIINTANILHARGIPVYLLSFEHLLTRTWETVAGLYAFAGIKADPSVGARVVSLQNNGYGVKTK